MGYGLCRIPKGIVLLIAALACSSDNGPSNPTDGNNANTVTVGNNVFTPSSLSVTAGSTVTWQWSSSGVVHNVTFEDQVTSDDRSTGSFPRTFSAAGTYSYHCTIHAAEGMTGTVTVTTAGTGGGGGGGEGGGGGGGGAYP
jgi:plastocyanin